MPDESLPPWTAPAASALSDPVILDAILEGSETPLCIIDPGLRFVRFNRAYAEMILVRWGRDLTPGTSLFEVVPEGEYRTLVAQEMRAALGGTAQRRTMWIDEKDGTRTLHEIVMAPVRGDTGAVVGVINLAHHRRQDPVSRPAAGGEPGVDFRRVFDEAPLGMSITRRDGTLLEVNNAFGKLLGTIPEKLVGRTISDITHAEDRGLSPVVALARGNLARYEVEKRYVRDDGRTVGVKVTATRLQGEEGLILANVVELGPALKSPAPTPAHDRRWKVAADTHSIAVALLSPDGTVIDSNRAFVATYGRGGALPPAFQVSDVEGALPAGTLKEKLAQARNGEVRFESVHRRPDGTTIPVIVTICPIQFERETFLCYSAIDISSMRAVETARAAADVKYRELVERTPNITLTFSNRRGGLFYSPQVEKILGYTPNELVAHPFRWAEAIHPDDRSTVDAALAALEKGGSFDLEFRIRHKDGSWHWIREWSASVGRIEDELIVVGQAVDLTPLREQERRFQRLVENVPDILYRWSQHPEPHFDYISAAVERVFGYTSAELTADPSRIAESVHPEDWAEVLSSHADPARDRGSLRLRGRHRDGHPVLLDVRRTVIRNPAGELIAIEGVARDVTAVMEAEARNALLSAGLEQASEVVIITDQDGRIVEVNAAFERLTGYTRGEALGRKPSLLKSGFQGADYYAQMWQTLAAGEIFRGTMVNRKKDGSNYVAEVVVTPIRDAGGEIVNYVGLQRDISRERLLDEALRQSQKMEAVGQVTGGVAHDFNNMLTVILANANLLETTLAPGSEAATLLREMVASAQHGTGLVRQLLAYGRKERLSPRPIRLADEFSAFVTILRRALSESIEISFAGNDTSWAQVDRTAFEQMLLNLGTNARDAMPNGGALRIRTAAREITESDAAVSSGERVPGRYTTISVTDTGKGMAPEVMRRVLEPFFTTKPVGKGTGLGLSMVYGLMQQHGGWVELESAVGVGTTVTLAFPIVAAPPVADAAAVTAPAEGSPGRGELILVVEDEEALRRVAARTLEQEGFAVITAADGEAGWSQWQKHGDTIALILTDAVMPKLSGPELIRRLDANGAQVPVILMSGYAAEDLSDPSLKHVAVVAKPWSGELLARRIREVLDAKMDG